MRLVFLGPEGNFSHDGQSILAGRYSEMDFVILHPPSATPSAVERAEADLVVVALESDMATRDVCRQLRGDGRTARVPLVGVLSRAPSHGGYAPTDMDAVLVRPVLPEDLVHAVQTLLTGSAPSTRDGVSPSSPAEAILEAMPVAAVAIAPDNTILKVNRAFERLVGRRRSEMVGLIPWTRLIHAADDDVRNNIAAVGTAATTTHVCRIIASLGEIRTVQVTMVALGVAGDRVLSLVDITAHHETDALLRVSEARYRTTLESINLGYFEVDLSGRLLFVNQPLCSALGISHDDLMSRQVTEIAAPSATRKLRALFGRVLRDGKTDRPVRIEMQIGPKSVVLELAVTRMGDAAGAPLGFRGLAQDVTNRLVREEEQRNIERLQGVVELAGAVCHELNQPLQSILGHSELLQMELAGDHPTQERIGKISGQVGRMREITAKLMNITQYRAREHYKGARIIDLGLGPDVASSDGDDPNDAS